MKFNWDLITLSELSLRTQYGYTASAEFSAKNGNPKFLRITDIQKGVVNWSTVPFCEIENNKLSLYKLEDGDIVVARTGNSTGENYCFESLENVIFASYLIRYKINKDKALPKFIWYQMRSKNWWDFVNNIKSGSAQAGANAKAIGKFPCTIPPLSIQKKIIHVLSTLDNKIELNKKINQTLESIAQTIFKSWFVDFDPVHAKANANSEDEYDAITKELGISREILDLFPSEFEESELGLIPKGWHVKSIKSICEVTDYVANGSFASLKQNVTYQEDGYAIVVRLTDYKSEWSGGFNYVDEHAYRFLKKSSVTPGDVIISNVGAYAGTVFRAANLEAPMTLGPNSILLKSELARLFLFYHFSSALGQHQLDGIKSGSAQPKFNKTDFRSIKIIKPSEDVLTKFNRFVGSIEDVCANNEVSNGTLSKLRDFILPKLLSGELDLSNLSLEPEND